MRSSVRRWNTGRRIRLHSFLLLGPLPSHEGPMPVSAMEWNLKIHNLVA
jgi:hypothetical protein